MRTKRMRWATAAAGLLWAAGVGVGGVRVGSSRPLHRREAVVWAQQAPTLTPTPSGPVVVAYQDDPVNVRNGPGTEYDQVGILVKGQTAPILGVAQVGPYTWFRIVYIGGPDNTAWVYKDVVRVVGDLLTVPAVTPPPTPTVRPTSTPGGAAAEGAATPGPGATRMPTFTAPPPVIRPTLLPVQGVRQAGGVPPAMIILSLLVVGVLSGVASLARRR